MKDFLGKLKDALVESDGDAPATPAPTNAPPQNQAVQAALVTSVVGGQSINPEALEQTRDAVFSIAGSPFTRFMAESKKLEGVITDPTMRIKAVVTMLGISPADLVGALQTTHRAALDQWQSQVARAKEDGHKSKVASREAQIVRMRDEDAHIQSQIATLQQQLEVNSQKAATLQQEITSAQAEMEGKARTYDAAAAATEAELNQTIATLQSIR